MKSFVIISAAILITGPSLAQAPSSQTPPAQNKPAPSQTQSNQTGAGGQSQNQSIRQQVQKNLSQAGYSDIKIMPESFLVRAKDKDGNPVMMVRKRHSAFASPSSLPSGSIIRSAISIPHDEQSGGRGTPGRP
jgi:hypothetical protein